MQADAIGVKQEPPNMNNFIVGKVYNLGSYLFQVMAINGNLLYGTLYIDSVPYPCCLKV